jgi:3-oxoacyl-[acyl-carrier-protein] synthase II
MTGMAVEGIGLVWSEGQGLDDLAARARDMLAGTATPANGLAETDALKNYLPTRALRRMDHFTRMTLLAAFEAVRDAGLDASALANTGIVLATGYGPAALTFDFLDSMIDFGPDMASPQAFAHSVHNIPAATVAVSLKLTGPCTTIGQIDTAVPAALLTAQAWLREGRVDRVLLGASDEYTSLLHATAPRLAAGFSGAVAGRRHLPPGDGAVFFCLHPDPARARHGIVRDMALGTTPILTPERTTFLSGCLTGHHDPSKNMHAFAPVYGSLPVAMAFDLVLATLAVNGRLEPTLRIQNAVQCQTKGHDGLRGALTVTRRTAS